MTTTLIRQIIARSGLDAYNEEISAACDAIDAQLSALEQQGEAVALDHIACIDGGELRYMSGRKAPAYDCELYAMPDGKRAPKLYTHPTPAPAQEVPDTVPRAALHEVERERDYYKSRTQDMYEYQNGEVWYWQGDGEDHPESWVNSLPVVIRADQLRELMATGRGEQYEVVPLYTAPPAADLTDEQIDVAAKEIAERFDYPWEHMPAKGRESMRETVRAIIAKVKGV